MPCEIAKVFPQVFRVFRAGVLEHREHRPHLQVFRANPQKTGLEHREHPEHPNSV
jgi:hypothetical protein